MTIENGGIPESDFINRRDFSKIVDESENDEFKELFNEDVSIDDFKKQVDDFDFDKQIVNPEDEFKNNNNDDADNNDSSEVVDDDGDDDSSEAVDDDDLGNSESIVDDSDESDDKDKKYRVKVDGNEYDVTLDELIKAYQLDAHITKKSQEVSKNIKDSQEIFNRVVAYNEQVKQLEAQLLAEHEEWLAENLDEDEAVQYKQNIENRKKQEGIDYSNFINSSYSELVKIHPDVHDIDNSEEFKVYRQEVAPMITQQHVAIYGPLALAPLYTCFKRELELKKQLDEAKRANENKEKLEKERKEKLREQKKKAQTTKSNSGGSTPKKDEQENLESDIDYLTRIKNRRGGGALFE